MIDELVVRNLGVIESARLEPSTGLTVITGETGTGKTLLLGALRLLLGGEARSGLVGPFDDETVVEGRFVSGDVEVGASRRLPQGGRSRAYLDGSIASAKALDERVAGLVDIVGQHDHLTLTRPTEVRRLLDRSLSSDGKIALDRYRSAWEEYRDVIAARDQLGGDLGSLSRELDLVRFQANEIADSGFAPGDDEELEALAGRLQNVDTIAEQVTLALESLDSGREAVGEAVAAMRRAARADSSAGDLAELLASNADALGDLSHEIRSYADTLETDPAQLAEVEARLNLLGDLRRKYGPTFEEVLTFGERAAARQTELESLLERAGVIDEEVGRAEKALAGAGEDLRAERQKAGDALAEVAMGHLSDLGFTDPLVRVDVAPAGPTGSGADHSEILFASDSRLTPGPVASVASGGELSRLVLALRLAGGSGEAETLVFDEVDAGVGGTTALSLGAKLAELARTRQVLCVTHLPQMAAFADRHYVVSRTDNVASVSTVEGTERVGELSRMLAGLPESERGREAAEELLELAHR